MNTPRQLPLFLFCLLLAGSAVVAQSGLRTGPDRCATMPRLEQRLQRDPQLRTRFSNQQKQLLRYLSQRRTAPGQQQRTNAVVTIPVVFHIVMANPSVVTDAQLQAQLDTLNRDFFGTNGDAFRVPSYFKPFAGKSNIQFCLAQRTPDGDETTGIIRKTSTRTTFDADDAVKYTSAGGADSWDTEKYFNVWICQITGGILGYATFPNDGAPFEQGVVMDYRSLPGGALTSYNGGKTLVHEAGHFFNLFHIWGDDNGLCTGTDFVDDTPNQGNATNGCATGVKTDACTPAGNGVMYQNYMDYSNDACLVMFTAGQVSRMEAALSLNRSSLLNSKGCIPVERKPYDAQLRTINSPAQRLCSPAFTPVVTIRNAGTQPLSSLSIQTSIDNGPVTVTNWTGNLVTGATANVTLTTLTAATGEHTLTVYTANPSARTDEDMSNDTVRFNFQYYTPVAGVNEGFESTRFPPIGWDIVNPDRGFTWQRTTRVAKSGVASVMINNFDYTNTGQRDDLRLPQLAIPATVDSAFFTFQMAAATYTATNTANNIWDTLEVLASTDCGLTYSSLYKKWGASLITRVTPETQAFVPTAAEWRKDSINLAGFIGQQNLLLLFRNTTGYENNIYLDDVTVRTVTINPNLKSSGFLVTPSPTTGQIAVQFYPQPARLKAIQVFSTNGQKLAEMVTGSSQANNYYQFDLSRFAAGVYYVRAVFADRVVTRKIVKM